MPADSTPLPSVVGVDYGSREISSDFREGPCCKQQLSFECCESCRSFAVGDVCCVASSTLGANAEARKQSMADSEQDVFARLAAKQQELERSTRRRRPRPSFSLALARSDSCSQHTLQVARFL